MTIGDLMKEIEKVITPEEAAALVDSEAKRICEQEGRTDYETVRQVVLSNIGYLSGYYDHARMSQIQTLFNTAHPIFGRTSPTPQEAYAAGVARAERGL